MNPQKDIKQDAKVGNETNDLYQLLVQNAPDAIFVVDLETKHYIDGNKPALDMFKLDLETLKTLAPSNLSSESQLDGRPSEIHIKERMARGLDPHEVEIYEWLAKDMEGRVFPVEIRINRFIHKGRQLERISIIDITKRKEQEEREKHYMEALEQSKRDHQAAQIIGKLGHWTWDIESDRIEYSDQVYSILEEEEGTVDTYSRSMKRIHPDDRKKVDDKIATCLKSKSKEYSDEHRILTESGEKFVHELGQMIFDGEIPIRMFGTMQDITEKKLIEIELAEIRHQLERSARMDALGRLAGGVAHDLNNLLASILGYTSIVKLSHTDDDELQENLNEIEKASKQASSMISQLLTFGKKQKMHPEHININYLVDETINIITPLLNNQVNINLEMDDNLPNVYVDPVQVKQVIMNLTINANDAMTNGGILTISTLNLGKNVMLTVTDTGHGMSQETREHIFEPFFTTKSEGTGLGMATVYGIITDQGGDIAVDSTIGVGTAISITLPVSNKLHHEPNEKPRKSEINLSELTVLLVDDNDALRNLVDRILNNLGVKVISCADPLDAIDAFESNTIDFLVSDVVMPNLNGLELMEKMVKQKPELKVLFITGYADAPVYKMLEKNNYKVLMKPFTGDELIRAINDVIFTTQKV